MKKKPNKASEPSPTARTERTNFEGNWSDICPHCSQPQKSHLTIIGPFDGIVYEHRMPCEPEKVKMRRENRRIVVTAKLLILIGWILVPLFYLILQQCVAIIGWIAFGIGVLQLGIVTIKHFGNPDRWIPGYKKKKEEYLRHRHFIYHCEKNPDGFERLRRENFEREDTERSFRAKEIQSKPNP